LLQRTAPRVVLIDLIIDEALSRQKQINKYKKKIVKITNRNGKRCYTWEWIKRTPGESGREGRHETRSVVTGSVVYAIAEIVNT